MYTVFTAVVMVRTSARGGRKSQSQPPLRGRAGSSQVTAGRRSGGFGVVGVLTWLLAGGCDTRVEVDQIEHIGYSDRTEWGHVECGWRGDELVFAVITAAERIGERGPVSSVVSHDRPTGVGQKTYRPLLRLPDGRLVRLPLMGYQLVEIRDGMVRFATQRISGAELRAFLAENRGLGLDRLLSFVHELRERDQRVGAGSVKDGSASETGG